MDAHSLFRTKPLEQVLAQEGSEAGKLKRVLGPWDLVAIGIGCIIGVGIFVLPGVEAATHAGPGIILSFAIAAAACACAALCYAELAAMIPAAGSAYTYGYATLGELPAWVIGWDLVLEYMVGACLVAIGWSAYFTNFVNNLLRPWGWALPTEFTAAPWGPQPGILNLPAMGIVVLLTLLLVRGIRESATVNLVIVTVKVAVILLFIALAAGHVNPANWQPFAPFGFSGIVTAAAIVFLANVGLMPSPPLQKRPATRKSTCPWASSDP